MLTESSILEHFDPTLDIEPRLHYPSGQKGDIHYHFWFDLEHGYFATAGSRLHLYADDDRWAVVTEKNGYANRGFRAEIELEYFGNCIEYPIHRYPERSYITNSATVILISSEEWGRVSKFDGEDQFELVNPTAGYVQIRDVKVPIESDVARYRALGIYARQGWEPSDAIDFVDLIRYVHASQPDVLFAREPEIREHIPGDLRKIMTVDNFHFSSVYSERHNPSNEELYQLIAKVLVNRDPSQYCPTLAANNHWSNWESGHL